LSNLEWTLELQHPQVEVGLDIRSRTADTGSVVLVVDIHCTLQVLVPLAAGSNNPHTDYYYY
jgi:hypothetical protein